MALWLGANLEGYDDDDFVIVSFWFCSIITVITINNQEINLI
jgi:hypothetical protein